MTRRDLDAVLFDLDDTLVQYRQTTAERLAEAFDRAAVEPFFTVDDFRRWAPKVDADDPLDFREQCFAGIAREQDHDPALGHRVAAAYQDPDPTDVRFRPGAEAALDALDADYRLGLVTNGGEEYQREKLTTLGIETYFDAAWYATPDAAIKPDPEPFYRILSEMDAEPEDTVHVGNSLTSDVAGAQAAGVGTVWIPAYDPPSAPELEPEYTLSSLHELVPPPWQ